MHARKLAVATAAVLTMHLATAQSSVTLFGIADTGFGVGRGSVANKTQLYNAGGNATSRLGFRGTEDLGSGMTASFWLEAQLNIDDGTSSATNTNNQATGAGTAGGLVFARRSTVSLAGNWGELRLGRDYTAHYRNRVDADPFGNVGVGTIQPQVGTVAGVTSTRTSNVVGYFSPNQNQGLYGQAQYYLGENTSGTPNSSDGTGMSVLGGYASGPLKIAASYGKTRYATTATIGDTASTNLGVFYDFPSAKLLVGLFRDKVDRTASLTAKGYSVATIVPLGVHQVKAAYSRYGTDATGSPTGKKISLGYVHNLSVRTALYATVARVTNSGGASFALNGATTTANSSSSGFDVGIRHSF